MQVYRPIIELFSNSDTRLSYLPKFDAHTKKIKIKTIFFKYTNKNTHSQCWHRQHQPLLNQIQTDTKSDLRYHYKPTSFYSTQQYPQFDKVREKVAKVQVSKTFIWFAPEWSGYRAHSFSTQTFWRGNETGDNDSTNFFYNFWLGNETGDVTTIQ